MSIRAKLLPIPLLFLAAAAAIATYVIANATATSQPRISGEPVAQATAKAQAAESNPAATITTVEPAQLAAFSVLGTSGEGPSAALAASINEGTLAAEYGLNSSAARPVGNETGVWLVPGNGALCLWELNSKGVGGGGTCATTAAAEAGELAISRMSEGGVQHVVGVVPNGTTSVSLSGSDAAIAIHDNGWETVTGSGTSVATIKTPNVTNTVEVP